MLKINLFIIDGIIIFFLILILISIQIYKRWYRWRSHPLMLNQSMDFSNEKPSNLLVILVLLKRGQKKLFKNFAFALKIIGYKVILMNPKINNLHFKPWKFKNLISLISKNTNRFHLHPLSLENYSMNSYRSIFLIFSNLKNFNSLSLLNHEKIKSIVLFNPKFKNNPLNTLKPLDPSFKDKLYFIFSEKSFFQFKNKHARAFLKNQSELLLRNVEFFKTKSRFLGMETIILSKILDIIQIHA